MQGARTLAPGSTIADYRVASLLRSVDGATVYRADQTALGRGVALVVSSAPSDSEPGARFGEIARRLAGLEHPHVLPVYEVGTTAGATFAAMREPPGSALDVLLREGPLTPERSVEIADQLGGALAAIDHAGVGPIELSARDVFVTNDDDVQVAALEAALSTSSAADARVTVARLLDAMVGGDRGALAPVLTRALGPQGPLEPAELIAAARAAVAPPPPTTRRGLVVGAAVVAAVAVAATAIAVLHGSADQNKGRAAARRAPVDAPGARLVATIALNGTPGSSTVGEGAVWVATGEGNVLRVDPRTNRVVGAPIRFAPSDPHNNVTVRAGGGAVFALDGNRGTIARIDPGSARVTLRRHLGGILAGATVSDGVVWVLRWTPPRNGRPATDELLRLDAGTLRRVGRPAPIGTPIDAGPQAADVEVAHGVAWVSNGVDGTVMRYDSATNASTTIRVGGKLADSALLDGTLWVPDVWGGALTPVDAREMRVPDASLHPDFPFSVTAFNGALWVVAQTTYTGPGGRTRLYRVDPRSRAVIGRPVELGLDVGWVAAGAGAVWVRSPPTHTLLKFVATSPAPPPRRTAPPRGTPSPVAAGRLRPGTWATRRFVAPFTFSIGEPGWLVLEDTPEGFEIGRIDNPLVGITINAPRQMFAPSGDLQRLRTPRQAVAVVTANPHVRIIERRRTSLGGVAATELIATARSYDRFPEFCQSPCVLLFALPAAQDGVETAKRSRMWFLRRGGRTVVATAYSAADAPEPGVTSALLRTLRFR